MKANHTDEILALEEFIEEKNDMINETDSRMSMISIYVDQLEERLASFALARKEINLREEACKAIEEKQLQTSEKCSRLEEEAKELSKARDELKSLVDLMVEERSKLQVEKDTLQKERDSSILQVESLRDELKILDENFTMLDGQNKEVMAALEQAGSVISAKDDDLTQLQQLHDASKSKLEEQIGSLAKSNLFSLSLQEEVERLEKEKDNMSTMIANLEEEVNSIRAQSEEKFATQISIEAEKLAEEKFQNLKATIMIADNQGISTEVDDEEIEEEAMSVNVERVNKESDVELLVDQDSTEQDANNIPDGEEIVTTFITEQTVEESKGMSKEIVDNHLPESDPDDVTDEIEEAEVTNTLEDDDITHEQPLMTPPRVELMNDEVETGFTCPDVDYFVEENQGDTPYSDSQYPSHPPPPPPENVEMEIENSVDEADFDRNVSFEPKDELHSDARSLTDEDTTTNEIDSMNKDDTFGSTALEDPPFSGENERLYNEVNCVENQQQGIDQGEHYYQINDITDNHQIPPPPPPMGESTSDMYAGQGNGSNSIQYETFHPPDLTHQFQSEIPPEQLANGFEEDVSNNNEHEIQHQESQDECYVNEPLYSDEGEYSRAEPAVQNVGSVTSEDNTDEVVVEENEIQDDFEIISDNEQERPAGYFEDHFDDEDNVCTFDGNNDDGDKEPSVNEEPLADEEPSIDDEPSLEQDEPELPADFEENDKINKEEDQSTDKSSVATTQGDEKLIENTKKRKVPFRRLRKTFSFVTGVHGAFTPSSKQLEKKS